MIRKKQLIAAGTVIFIFFAAVYLANNYLLRGALVINTDRQAKVSIKNYSDGSGYKISSGPSKVHLKPGEYIISAQTGNGASKTSVNIKARKTTVANLGIVPTSPSQIAARDDVALKLHEQGSQIIFLASSPRLLFGYNPQTKTNTPYLSEFYPVSQADWIDGGIIISTGNSFSAFIPDGGSQKTIGENLSSKESNYSVSKNGRIVFVENNSLMFKTNPTANKQKVLNLSNGSYHVDISSDGSHAFVYSEVNEADSKKPEKLNNYMVNLSDPQNPVIFTSNSSISSSVWSDDGKSLAYSIGQRIYIHLSDGSMLSALVGTESAPLSLVGFLGNEHLVYAASDSLWNLDITNNVSKMITDIDGSINPSSFYIFGNDLLYSTATAQNGKGGNIYRVNL